MGLMIAQCFRCSATFNAYSRRNRFCSVKCRNAHKNSLRITINGVQKKPSVLREFECEVCDTKFSASVGDLTVTPTYRTCSQKCSTIRANELAYEPHRKAGTVQIYECRFCGDAIEHLVRGSGHVRWTCDPCKLKNKRDQYRRHSVLGGRHESRARYYSVPYETIDKLDIFERDGWICQLCNEAVDPDCEFPSLKYATIDHIIPLSTEGTPGHVWGNIQLAHFSCNSRKGNRS